MKPTFIALLALCLCVVGCGKTAPDQQTTPQVERTESTLTPGMVTAKRAYDEGRYKEAVRLYTAELAAEEAKVAPSWVQLSYLNNQLGFTLDAAGQYDKALEFHQKALAILLKQLGADHPKVATSYHNIGVVHNSKGEYDLALEYYQKALALQLKTHPQKTFKYREHTVQAGELLSTILGAYNQAFKEEGFKGRTTRTQVFKVNPGLKPNRLTINQKIRIPLPGEIKGHPVVDHPSVAHSYSNMARLYYAKKDLAKAKEYLGKAHAILLKKLGPNHPKTKDAKAGLDILNK